MRILLIACFIFLQLIACKKSTSIPDSEPYVSTTGPDLELLVGKEDFIFDGSQVNYQISPTSDSTIKEFGFSAFDGTNYFSFIIYSDSLRPGNYDLTDNAISCSLTYHNLYQSAYDVVDTFHLNIYSNVGSVISGTFKGSLDFGPPINTIGRFADVPLLKQ